MFKKLITIALMSLTLLLWSGVVKADAARVVVRTGPVRPYTYRCVSWHRPVHYRPYYHRWYHRTWPRASWGWSVDRVIYEDDVWVM